MPGRRLGRKDWEKAHGVLSCRDRTEALCKRVRWLPLREKVHLPTNTVVRRTAALLRCTQVCRETQPFHCWPNARTKNVPVWVGSDRHRATNQRQPELVLKKSNSITDASLILADFRGFLKFKESKTRGARAF